MSILDTDLAATQTARREANRKYERKLLIGLIAAAAVMAVGLVGMFAGIAMMAAK